MRARVRILRVAAAALLVGCGDATAPQTQARGFYWLTRIEASGAGELVSNAAYVTEGSLYLDGDSGFQVSVSVWLAGSSRTQSRYSLTGVGQWAEHPSSVDLQFHGGGSLTAPLSIVNGVTRVVIPYDLDGDGRADRLTFDWADRGPG